MYESEVLVGERGQITIPKIIREKEGIRSRDKLVVKIEDNKIVVEKAMGRKEKERLMKEYYAKYSGLLKEVNKEWEVLDKEANRHLK